MNGLIWKNAAIKLNNQSYLIYMPYSNIKIMTVPETETISQDMNNAMMKYNTKHTTTFHNTPYIPIYEPDQYETVTSRATISEMVEMVMNEIPFTIRFSHDIRDIDETIDSYFSEISSLPISSKEIEIYLSNLHKLKNHITKQTAKFNKKENVSPKLNMLDVLSQYFLR